MTFFLSALLLALLIVIGLVLLAAGVAALWYLFLVLCWLAEGSAFARRVES